MLLAGPLIHIVEFAPSNMAILKSKVPACGNISFEMWT